MRDFIPDYDLDNPSTWNVIRQNDAVGETEFRSLTDILIRIAGLNPHGKPNLELRWGVTFLDSQNLDDKPKYYVSTNDEVLVGHQYRDDDGQMCTVKHLTEVPAHKISIPLYSATHLGERKWVIERWRDPAFLENSGRYGERRDKETGEVLLKELPREGYYDFFMRLERPDGSYRPVDGLALGEIEREWHRQQRSFAEKDREVKEARKKISDDIRQQKREVWHPDNLLNKESICT